jgi:hypothetical protein
MKRVGVVSTAFLLFVLLGATAFGYAQQEQQSEKQGKPEKQAEPQQQAQPQQQRASVAAMKMVTTAAIDMVAIRTARTASLAASCRKFSA